MRYTISRADLLRRVEHRAGRLLRVKVGVLAVEDGDGGAAVLVAELAPGVLAPGAVLFDGDARLLRVLGDRVAQVLALDRVLSLCEMWLRGRGDGRGRSAQIRGGPGWGRVGWAGSACGCAREGRHGSLEGRARLTILWSR